MFATDKLQTLPPWVLKNLAALEDAVAGVTKAQKDKMNKNNSTAFNKVKSKLKKYLTEGGDVDFHFSEQLIKYRENPIASDDDSDKKDDSDDNDSSDDDSSDDDSDSGSSSSEKKPKKKEEKKKVAKKDDDSSSEEDSDSSSSSGSSSSSVASANDSSSSKEIEKTDVVVGGKAIPKKYQFLLKADEEKTPAERRWKWVKYEALPEDM